ncbi:hemk methyltransferase family member 2-like [Stylonychia lemnae]|uniref:Hemk methyltransferase family member 2-like n=1 Tax=Stylonychia lemnae TaxID=5949 RepID=A0A078B896_STYLE|nr:hemk methyltransferase family member 2-like [Stylonychia lemnae]|eukprot:CDW89788.1 hemk methyltransferase family member 2-like [Stylonychia lemnae]
MHSNQTQIIQQRQSSLCILQRLVRVGSGVVINSLQKLLAQQSFNDAIYFGIDINIKALDVTLRTAIQNNCDVQVIQQSFCHNFTNLMKGSVDVFIFNPPYVVTPEDELMKAQQKRDIEASWAGGKDGIQVLMAFIPKAYEFLSEKGVFYLLLIEENLKILKRLGKLFDIVYLVKRECPGERQVILRLTKKQK